MYASANKLIAIVEMLIRNGADPKIKNVQGLTALHYAIAPLMNVGKKNVLREGVLNSISPKDSNGKRQQKIIEILIENKADPVARGKSGTTPLSLAVTFKKKNIALLLLDKGAYIQTKRLYKKGIIPSKTAKINIPIKDESLQQYEKTDVITIEMAVVNKLYKVIEELLKQGIDPNIFSHYEGTTLLNRAIQTGSMKMVELLLSKGAEPSLKDRAGNTAVIYAARKKHATIMKLLLEYKADLKTTTYDGTTPLMVAAGRGNNKVVSLLIKYGAQVDAKDLLSDTALMRAAENGHAKVVKLLVNRGADVNLRDNYNRTAIIRASKSITRADNNSLIKIYETLLNAGADPNMEDIEGETALISIINNHYSKVGSFISFVHELPGAKSRDILMDALTINKTKGIYARLVILLANRGANLSYMNKLGETALTLAAEYGNVGIVNTLLEYHVDPNIRDYKRKDTPLMRAAKGGNLGVVNLLIKAGADINAVDEGGDTALTNALEGRNSTSVLKTLLDAGANPAMGGKLYNIGMRLAIMNGERSSYRDLELLLQAGINPNIENSIGFLPIVEAIYYNKKNAVKLLLKYGADPNLQDRTGRNALMTAYKAKEEGQPVENIIKMLIDARANLEICNDKYNELIEASKNGDSKEVEKLLREGAKVNVRDKNGFCPLVYAICNVKLEIVNLLLAKGADPNVKSEVDTKAIDYAIKKYSELEMDSKKCSNMQDRQKILKTQEDILEIIKSLMRAGVSTATRNNNYGTILLAVKYKLISVLEILINYNANDAEKEYRLIKALECAVSYECLALAGSILSNGLLVNYPSCEINKSLCSAISNGDLDMVKLLCKYGGNIKYTDQYVDPLLSRVIYGVKNKQLLKYLLEEGVELESRYDGKTALYRFVEDGDTEAVCLLLDYGANINIVRRGSTPLTEAIKKRNREMVRLLLERGANPYIGYNALSCACNTGQEYIVKLLLDYDVDPRVYRGDNSEQQCDSTPLICACLSDNVKIVKMILDKNVEVNYICRHRGTALNCAVTNKNLEIVKVLLKHGADPNTMNQYNVSPLMLAEKEGNKEIRDLLLKHNGKIKKLYNLQEMIMRPLKEHLGIEINDVR